MSVNGLWANGLIVEVFIAPEYEKNPMDAKYSVGTVDCYSAESNLDAETALNDVTLSTGTYTVSYKVIGKNEAAVL